MFAHIAGTPSIVFDARDPTTIYHRLAMLRLDAVVPDNLPNGWYYEDAQGQPHGPFLTEDEAHRAAASAGVTK